MDAGVWEKCDPGLRSLLPGLLSRQARSMPVSLILAVDRDCPARELTAMRRRFVRLGCRESAYIALTSSFTVRISAAKLPLLAADDRIRRIHHDRLVFALLDRARQTINAPLPVRQGHDGAGVTVAVVDTGIAPHPDFGPDRRRIVAFFDAVNRRNTLPYDDNGHGTHVAGCVAGDGRMSGGRYAGVAPSASLIGVKVLSRDGSGRLSTILYGLDWLASQATPCQVVNLSLGAHATLSYQDDVLAQAAAALVDRGKVVVAAAGNSGPAPQTIATPAIHPKLIAVGAADDRVAGRPPVVASFSSRGPAPSDHAAGDEEAMKPDLVAPGVEIVAASAGGAVVSADANNPSGYYRAMSGTSMAAPLVSGAAALLLCRMPDLTPDRVAARLRRTAHDLGVNRFTQGAGLLDVEAALS